eukprot:GEMP01040120.1.p1 GENE.GEMP01040120.1~~GEMP01040120.1.p1  ORF type:complete len:178 (+),score=13.41 GEMP01040120.1:2-535(+)
MHLFYYQQAIFNLEQKDIHGQDSQRDQPTIPFPSMVLAPKTPERVQTDDAFIAKLFDPGDAELGCLRVECEALLLDIPTPKFPPESIHESSWARLIYAEDLKKFHAEQYRLIVFGENSQQFSKADRRNLRARLLHELDSLSIIVDDLRRVCGATTRDELLIIRERWEYHPPVPRIST